MDRLEVDRVVCEGLGKRRDETLVAAARRVVATPGSASRRRLAAHIILAPGEPWDSMYRAASVLSGRAGVTT